MKRFLLVALALCALNTYAIAQDSVRMAEAHNLGPGTWSCGRVIELAKAGSSPELGQAVGWVLGSWSFATTVREEEFKQTVKSIGPIEIFKRTIAECQKVVPEIMMFRIVNTMIAKTSPKTSANETQPDDEG
ncbi:MAG: hypothetical protein AAFR27_10680 [Pseudomonadota bacterium]